MIELFDPKSEIFPQELQATVTVFFLLVCLRLYLEISH